MAYPPDFPQSFIDEAIAIGAPYNALGETEVPLLKQILAATLAAIGSGGSVAIVIDSTEITGGTSGYILYNNPDGTVGEIDLFGTANTWMATQNVQNLIPSVDNIYDIGAQFPGKRFAHGFFAGRVDCQYIQLGPTGIYIYPSSFASQQAFRFTDSSGSTSAPLMLGPGTSSFSAIKPLGTDTQFRLGDDSDFAAVESLYDRFGSGSPEGVVTAPVGACYHRTDGGGGPSFYVKESGTGNSGWVGK